MTERPSTFAMAARIFLAITWRTFAIGIPVMLVTGVVTAGLFSSLGNEGANTAARIATFLVMIPVEILCIQLVIGKAFAGYTLVLQPEPPRGA